MRRDWVGAHMRRMARLGAVRMARDLVGTGTGDSCRHTARTTHESCGPCVVRYIELLLLSHSRGRPGFEAATSSLEKHSTRSGSTLSGLSSIAWQHAWEHQRSRMSAQSNETMPRRAQGAHSRSSKHPTGARACAALPAGPSAQCDRAESATASCRPASAAYGQGGPRQGSRGCDATLSGVMSASARRAPS
jgi:hypothetical protein